MKIDTMDRESVNLLSNAIEAALQPLAAKYGVQIKRGSASFNDSNFILKIEVATVQDGQAVGKEATDFKRYAEFVGLKAEDLGKTINYGRPPKTYTIIGYLPRSERYPILAQDASGRHTKLQLQAVIDALGHQEGTKTKPDGTKAADDGLPPMDLYSVPPPGKPDSGMPSIDELSKQLSAGHDKLTSMAPLFMKAWLANGFTGEKNDDSRNEG